MTPFEAYQMFQALKSHFNSSYDYFKYNGKTSGARNAFDKLKTKYHFEKLAKIKDLETYLLANFLDRPIKWVKDVLDERSEQVYTEFLRKKQSLSYRFAEELKLLDDDNFTSNFRDPNGNPLILKEFEKGISLDTFTILDILIQFSKYYDGSDIEYAEWPRIKARYLKYAPFLRLTPPEREIFKKIVLTKYSHRMNNVDKKNN